MKLIDNCSLQELKELLCESVPYDIIELVYNYLHRNKIYTVQQFADCNNISTTSLYRKVKNIKSLYEKFS